MLGRKNSNHNKRILIFNPYGIGDVLFTFPFVKNLKEKFPYVQIYYMCNRRVEQLIEEHQLIDGIIVFEKDEWRQLAKQSYWGFFIKLIKWIKTIADYKFDIVFDLSNNDQYGFFLFLMGIKRRFGYGIGNRGRWLTKKIEISGYKNKHVAEHVLDLLSLMSVPVKKYPMEFVANPGYIKHFQAQWGKLVRPLIGVAPGGGESWGENAIFKLWPAEYFAALVQKLKGRFKSDFIFFGSDKDKNIIKNIKENLPFKIIDTSGKFNLSQLAAGLSVCDVIIANDGGIFHLAQALGKKVIGIFGPVDEKVYGKYPDNNINTKVISSAVSCRPCYRNMRFAGCKYNRKCLYDILPEQIVALVDDFIYKQDKDIL